MARDKQFLLIPFALVLLGIFSGCGSDGNTAIATEDEVAAFVEENKDRLSKPLGERTQPQRP
jgi:hypothetical protein